MAEACAPCASVLPARVPARQGLLGLAAAIVLAAVLGVPAAHAAKRAPAADPEDLRALRSRIERLRDDIANSEESRNEARDALRESERAISAANRALRTLAAQRQSARAELTRLSDEARRLEAELAARQQALGRLLTVRYLGGQADYLKLIVSGIDPNQTVRDLYYYGYISRAQAELVRSLRATLTWLQELQEQTRAKTAELAEIEQDQKKERDLLAREQSNRRRVLDKVSAQLRDQRREVRGLQRDESRLTRLVEELARVIADEAKKSRPGRRNEQVPHAAPDTAGADRLGTAFAKLKGLLRLPIRGELISRFGGPRPEGGPNWKGLFIKAPPGQEVRAVAGGRVVFADWMRGFGNLLILDHGQAYLTIYGNNESVLKTIGEVVHTGDVVATSGASGGSAQSGLYFEMRHAGRPFDPLTWVVLK